MKDPTPLPMVLGKRLLQALPQELRGAGAMDWIVFLAACGLLLFFLTMDVLWRKPRQRRHHLPRRAVVRRTGNDGEIGYATYVVGGGPAVTLPGARRSGAFRAAKAAPGSVPGGIVLRPSRL